MFTVRTLSAVSLFSGRLQITLTTEMHAHKISETKIDKISKHLNEFFECIKKSINLEYKLASPLKK